MSVVGFDVGNDCSCVALARKRGIDVLMNKESKRETPAVVNFGEKMRFLGTDGAAKMGLSPQNTVAQLKRILGKKFNDPDVQEDIKKLLFSVTEGSDGGCVVNVQYAGERQTFTPEQLLAMVLVDLKRSVAEKEGGVVVTDCAISVPTFFTESQRYAVLNAAQIAGVNCLQLINENTATALAYGIYKTDLPEATPVHVVFVDVGYSATQVSVVALKKTGMVVLSHAWDQNLGGRDFDEALFDHFCAEFKEKFKVDIKTNKKASYKLRVACEKVKKMLSANAEAPLNIECIMDDKDVRGMMTRDVFEKLIEPVVARLRKPLEEAMTSAKVNVEDISSVEVVGSSTRVPAVFKQVEEYFRRMPSRTMNSKECVSRGAALRCAMLSPVFKVRDFDVVDAAPYGVDFQFAAEDGVKTVKMFERNSHVPNNKMLTFFRKEPFNIAAYYSADSPVPPAQRKIAEFSIGPFTVPPGQEKAKLKAKLQINLNGIVGIDSVTLVEEVEEAAAAPEAAAAGAADGPTAAPSTDAKMEDAQEAPKADGDVNPEPEAGAAPMETEAKVDAAAPKKVKVVKHKVNYSNVEILGYSGKQLEDYFEKECQMQAADKLQEETNERKNALESYVFELRHKLSESLATFVTDAQKARLVEELQKMEDWLYEEGEDERKSVYVAKLEELRALGGPVEARAVEDATRGPLAEQLRASAETYRAAASSHAVQYDHIDATDKATVSREAEAALTWLNEKLALQGQLNKWDEPVLLTSDIVKKRDTLDRVAKPILNKPPPPKPKPEAAPTPPPAEAPANPEPMEADAPQEGAAAGDADAPPPLVEEMET